MKKLVIGLGLLLALATSVNATQTLIGTGGGNTSTIDKEMINANFTEVYSKTVTADPVVLCYLVGDETTNLSTSGNPKLTVRAPYAFTLTAVRTSVTTAPTGTTLLVDVNEGGTTVLTSAKVMIDAGEYTSTTATTAYGLADTAIANDAAISFDIDQIGNSAAGAGLKVCLYGTRAL